MVTTEEIKKLRDLTGVSVMQCKKALEEAEGDLDKAVLILRKKSKDIASKKSERTLGAGVVSAYIHSSGNVGAMVELASETDFVSANEDFKKLAYDIAMHIAASNPEFLRREDVPENTLKLAKEMFEKEAEESGKTDSAIKEKIVQGKLDSFFMEKTLLEQPYIKNPEITVGNLVEEAVQKFGENIEIGRFSRYSISSN